ncbi:hypothetical protein ABZW03_22705 [Kitasatospora sp. NPDC004799]|uniref:hypothetical protein n=1 Tax=Kitasatospora sp. NPDC004799 TaxID=3154460 RepID=UPI0033B0E59E
MTDRSASTALMAAGAAAVLAAVTLAAKVRRSPGPGVEGDSGTDEQQSLSTALAQPLIRHCTPPNCH